MRTTEKGSYMLDLNFVDGTKTEVTVDSGAEDSVCPLYWGDQYGLKPAKKWKTFRSAGGDMIEHYGERIVRMSSPF